MTGCRGAWRRTSAPRRRPRQRSGICSPPSCLRQVRAHDGGRVRHQPGGLEALLLQVRKRQAENRVRQESRPKAVDRGPCGGAYHADDLNDTVVSDVAALVVQAQDRENTDLPALQNQLAQTERGIENLLNAIQQGIFTASTKQRLDELEEVKEELTVASSKSKSPSPHDRGGGPLLDLPIPGTGPPEETPAAAH